MTCFDKTELLLSCGSERCAHQLPVMALPLQIHEQEICRCNFARLFQIIDNIGNWLNYVATLSLVEQLAGGKGLLISALIIVRFLPSFLMFPLAGVVADRFVPATLPLCAPFLWLQVCHTLLQVSTTYFLEIQG